MARIYTQLSCGCYISCDGGGGLIPSCSVGDSNCKVIAYMKEHKTEGYYCPICQPIEYQKKQKRKDNESY